MRGRRLRVPSKLRLMPEEDERSTHFSTAFMTSESLEADSSEIVEVVRHHHRAYAGGSDEFLKLLAFPLLVRRRGITRCYLTPDSYSRDAAQHLQTVIRSGGVSSFALHAQAVILLGRDIGCVRFNSVRLNREGGVLSIHAASNVLIRDERGWRITANLADDDALVSDQLASFQ
jgi:hypothetical protein